jgi:Ca2+-binding EF-hand superfamily protein
MANGNNNIADRFKSQPNQSELKSYLDENLKAEMTNFFNPNRVLGNLRYLNKPTQPNPINSLNYMAMNTVPTNSKNFRERERERVKDGSGNSNSNSHSLGNQEKKQLNKLDPLVEFIFDKIRQKIIPRGISGILSIGKALRTGDNDNSRKINFFDFSNIFYKYGLGLNDSEIKSLFAAMDLYRTCFINYDEFLQRLRGYLSPLRQSIVEKAFYSIDKHKKRQVDYFDICGSYDASRHPLVKTKENSVENVYNDFLNSLQMNHAISHLNKSNFIITLEEFIEYYEYVSIFIENDQYFNTILGNCWGGININQKENNSNNNIYNNNLIAVDNNLNFKEEKKLQYNNNYNNFNNMNNNNNNNNDLTNNNNSYNIFSRSDLPSYIIEKAEYVLNKFKQKLISIGQFALFNLTKQFNLINLNRNNLKTFNYDDLVNISKEFKIDMSQSESINLFQALDRNGNFFVETQYFLNLLKGQMNDRRKNIVKLAFKILDVENKGTIDLSYLKRRFNVRYNVDVLTGKRSEEEAFGEFLHSLEYHFSSYKDKFDRKINLDEFIDYYNMVSFCVENDEHFEVMVKSTWKF